MQMRFVPIKQGEILSAHSDALRVLSSQIARLKSDHMNRLHHASNLALEQCNPMHKATYDTTIKVAAQAAFEELRAHAQLVREQVALRARQLFLPLTDESKAQLLAIAGRAFDPAVYPLRLQMLEEAMARKGERMGINVKNWHMRSDIQIAAQHAATTNMIQRDLAMLADELELIKLQSAHEAATLTTRASVMNQNNTFNVSGDNARVNYNSVDNSTNVFQADTRVGQYINDLRNALVAVELSSTDKEAALEVVGQVEATLQSDCPQKSVVTALLDALPKVADVTTIVTGLVGLLVQLKVL